MNGYKEWKRRQQHNNDKDDDETYKSQLKKRMKLCRENQYVYLQPVKVENELRKKLNIDYIFVVDTEGLSSFSHGYEHDNELSTFVIGLTNITLILIKGENKKYLQDILPISVLAFLRMEQQGLQPKCKFVHQNVAETARKKLITEVGELQSLLNDKTQEACDIEKVSHRNFASIIDFDINRDVEYIPSLSEG